MDATVFGAKLRELRKAAGLTQHELAAKSGITRSAIAKFELGEREPLLSTAQALAAAIGVDCTAFNEATTKPSKAETKPATKPRARKKKQ